MSKNYKKLYLKYKKKYLKLKNQLGGAANNVPTFETCRNNGNVTIDGIQYMNSCIWISIYDYLTKILGYQMTIGEMTTSNNLRCNNDFNVSSDSIDADVLRIAQLFNLEIILKRSFSRNGILFILQVQQIMESLI